MSEEAPPDEPPPDESRDAEAAGLTLEQESAAEPPAPDVVPTRRLIAASFDLLSHSSDELRRASFYVGAIVLGTAGPLALASFAVGVAGTERSPAIVDALVGGSLSAPLALLAVLATLGFIVASVESRILAASMLGGRLAGRPITPRQALARSRTVFWRAVAASVIVAVPIAIAQQIVSTVADPFFGAAVEASVVSTTLVTAVVGAPFAYALSGVVLGDVDPFEAVRRSLRVFGARRLAAALVVTFETVALILIFVGATTGLDLALRLLDALGLGFDAGPAGLALMTAGIVAAVFAFGTLLATVIAITVAPQVVMFVGLTQATMGLDRVRPGAPADPDAPRRRLRTFPLLMLGGFGLGALLLGIVVQRVAELGA